MFERQKINHNQKKEHLFKQGLYAGLYSSFGLMLLFFIVFSLNLENSSFIKYFYMMISFLMMVLFIISAYIIKHHIKNIGSSFLRLSYPFIVVTIGALNFYLGSDFLTERLSFYIIMFITTMITFNSIIYSVVLYSYALILYNITVFIKFGYDSKFYVPLLLYIVFCAIVNIIYNLISYKLIFFESQFNILDKNEKAAIQKLKESNYELEYTQKIAHMMMEITTDIITNDDLESLFSVIIKRAVEVMPNATAGSILLKNGDHIRYVSAYGYDLDKLKKIKMTYQDTFQYKLGNINKPEIIQDSATFNKLKTSEAFSNQFKALDIPSSKSVITCPILVNDIMHGSINLDNIDTEFAFKENDKPIVLYLAKQIGLALKNHELMNKTLHYTRHDMLTNAYSRIHHEELLRKTYEQARLMDYHFSLAIIDINNLKIVNDTFGHQAGDSILKFFSQQTKNILKENHYLSRTGGDEFTIIFDQSEIDETCLIINQMKTFFKSHPVEINDTSITIEFGAGIAHYPLDGDIPNVLLNIADKRMYIDKNKQKSNAS